MLSYTNAIHYLRLLVLKLQDSATLKTCLQSSLLIGDLVAHLFWVPYADPIPENHLYLKVPEGHHPRGTTLREALRGNLPLRGLREVSPRVVRGSLRGFCGALRGSAGSARFSEGFRGW